MNDFNAKSEFTGDAEQLAALEEKNQERLLGWWGLLGAEPKYPADTATVAKLLSAVDYMADGDALLGYVTDGIIPPVEREAGRLRWSATNIVAAACVLDARRRWKPFSKIHGHKMTWPEKLVQLAEHGGQQAFSDLHCFDVEQLLAGIVAVAHDPGAVATMTMALRQKLKSEGVL